MSIRSSLHGVLWLAFIVGGHTQAGAQVWMDTSLGADERAGLLLAQMTQDEKLTLVHGIMPLPIVPGVTVPTGALIGAGYVPGVPRLGIPALKETDASLGVAYVMGLRHDGATPLPSGLALAAGWDPQAAYDAGAMIGQEARRKGFNVLLAGGANLAREPRNGRNFEYLGEDPLLAGALDGEAIRGIQDQHVVSTLKHFALNDQETGRQQLNVVTGDSEARESDLLAFELALERGHPGAVMCSYNRINGPYACASRLLLTDVLKTDWNYPGWVMSDWGAVHGLESALNGLDQESGAQLDDKVYFDDPLRRPAAENPANKTRLDDMVRRILRSMFAVGLFDHPPVPTDIDFAADARNAQKVAEVGIVLLANPKNILPLGAGTKRIVIIGGHADLGVISGGGSSQVAPPGGPATAIPLGSDNPLDAFLHNAMYMPSSPLRAIKAKGVAVTFENGAYPSAAAAAARRADVAIVFATQWMGEGYDAPDLTLPDGQDALIEAVAAANPNTIVVLETGGPVLMPWLPHVAAVLEAWFPGGRGGEAIANVLFGDVNPSGHLPMSFPADAAQLPYPVLQGAGQPDGATFDVHYREGSDVGYRWYARSGAKPLFPFGFGLSYTGFTYSDLTVKGGRKIRARFKVTNTGARTGSTVPQLYLVSGPSGAARRLLGWQRVTLRPGETRNLDIAADMRLLAGWDAAQHGWRVAEGNYRIALGELAEDLSQAKTARLDAQTFKP